MINLEVNHMMNVIKLGANQDMSNLPWDVMAGATLIYRENSNQTFSVLNNRIGLSGVTLNVSEFVCLLVDVANF